jgi:dTDP-4-dehydrorhamnose 3,5-epimerase
MQISELEFPGCYEIFPRKMEDKRGVFIKTYHEDTFVNHGLKKKDFVEEYYSKSYQNVLRGLHFQNPPQDHVKMVYCVSGKILDVIVDLRIGSPTYGEFRDFELSDVNAKILLLDKGIAHGFYTRSKEAIVMYKVSSMYSQNHDKGILWNSLNIPWPTKEPILSERDASFPSFQNFDSPFEYLKNNHD